MTEQDRYSDPVAEWVVVGGMLVDPGVIPRVLGQLKGEHFTVEEYRWTFESMAILHSRGVAIDVISLSNELRSKGHGQAVELAAGLLDAPTPMNIGNHCQILKDKWHARELKVLCDKTLSYLDTNNYSDGGRKIADSLSSRVLQLYADTGIAATERKEDLIDRLIARSVEDEQMAINLPWPKLATQVGPLVRGEVVGLTGFSGQGKSTVATNMFAGFCKAGVPVIAFSTEMGEQWLARAAATESLQSQMSAEKNIWSTDDYGRLRYQKALERMRSWPFELVVSPNVKPEEIINRTRALRSRWPGRTVVVMVDHMHRLDYGREDANEKVGWATKLMKNEAKADRDGLVFVLLFQPRKPDGLEMMYKPVAAHQIRGDSAVWNELDTHLSPYRTFVKTMGGDHKTPWGTPAAWLDGGGSPMVVEPKNGQAVEGSKLSDEHLFISIDKRRIGGPVDRPVWLNFHAPSGRVSEGKPEEEQVELHQEVA